MTPLTLDSLFNIQVAKEGRGKSAVAEAKKKIDLLGHDVVEEEDLGFRLYDNEFDQMEQFEKNSIMLGIDVEEADYNRK